MSELSKGEKRRLEIKSFIRDFIIEHGFSPSMRQIAEAVGLKSPSSVQVYLASLVGRGQLRQPRPTVFALPPDEWRSVMPRRGHP